MGYAFISYSSKNSETAYKLREILKEHGIDTWIAPDNIPGGSRYAEVIADAIIGCSCFLLLLTDDAMKSTWVPKEVERAVNYKKRIIPIQLENVTLTKEFELYISTDQGITIPQFQASSAEMQNLIESIRISVGETPERSAAAEPQPNYQIAVGALVDGRYRILRRISTGAFTVVYLVVNEKTNKTWVMKVIQKGTEKYRIFKHNLYSEVSLLNNLKHLGIPEIVDILEDQNQLLVVVEYITGIDLSKILMEKGAQSEDVVLDWAMQLCNTLEYLHGQTPAIVCNDIKPSNIMCTPEGRLMLIDFGTSRAYGEQKTDAIYLGTMGYASPELCRGGDVDQRSDIYALGVTIYHMVTGNDPTRPPYGICPIRELNPALSTGLEYIITKCTKLNPDDRYQSVEELRSDLQNIQKISKRLSWSKFAKEVVSLLLKS